MNVYLSKIEAQIAADVLGMVLNDPTWQDAATATDEEWTALEHAYAKIRGAAR